MDFLYTHLPAINACLNAMATTLLTIGFFYIRKDKERYKTHHRTAMVSAFIVSTLFLGFYLLHKYLKAHLGTGLHTAFAGEGIWQWIYYPMLISHILLAMGVLPLIFITFYHALKGQFTAHRKWARWTFPIWYYVSITGVFVYFFLYQWFTE